MGIRGRLLIIVLAAVLPLPFFALFFARENLIVFAIAALAACLLGSAVAFRTARNVASRLQGLERVVQRIGEGDFSVRVPESGTDTNEIATLERAFNTTVDRVAERRARFVELDTLK